MFHTTKNNPELKQTFAQYGVNSPRLDRLGSNVRQRVHCLDATYVQGVVLKMMLPTADLWAKKYIPYGGHFCRMGNPVTVKAWVSGAKCVLDIFACVSCIHLPSASKTFCFVWQ